MITIPLIREKAMPRSEVDDLSQRFLEGENDNENNHTLKLENEGYADHPTFRYLFYGMVGMGKGQGSDKDKIETYKLLFDTGSCEFWVMSTKCTSPQCKRNKLYKDSKSKTEFNKGELDIAYMDGLIEGRMMKEDIYIGDNLLVT